MEEKVYELFKIIENSQHEIENKFIYKKIFQYLKIFLIVNKNKNNTFSIKKVSNKIIKKLFENLDHYNIKIRKYSTIILLLFLKDKNNFKIILLKLGLINSNNIFILNRVKNLNPSDIIKLKNYNFQNIGLWYIEKSNLKNEKLEIFSFNLDSIKKDYKLIPDCKNYLIGINNNYFDNNIKKEEINNILNKSIKNNYYKKQLLLKNFSPKINKFKIKTNKINKTVEKINLTGILKIF